MKAPSAVLALLALAACIEPPKSGQMEQAVMSLEDLWSWDPNTKAKGQAAYEAVVGWGPEIFPHLVAHLTDLTPTKIYEPTFKITPTVGDVCFLLLLDLTGRRWQEFQPDGVFVQSVLPNPVFNVRWPDPGARQRVQKRFLTLLDLED